MNIRLPDSLRKRLEDYCERSGLKMSPVIKTALHEYLTIHGA